MQNAMISILLRTYCLNSDVAYCLLVASHTYEHAEEDFAYEKRYHEAL